MDVLEQRRVALATANEVRLRRAELKRELRAGRVTIEALLMNPPAYVRNATIFEALTWLPHYGREKASRLLRRADIAAGTTFERLTPKRRQALIRQIELARR
jgi:hypothetical protein